jgi:glycosyltransferase involved in cell wall biosynthesis
MIRLSFIVPFYNVEKYIEECIRSLYNQDIPQEEYEVICVDDCSPDGSKAIVEQLQKEYSTLRLICHERNKKLGGARNTGLKAAKGRYVWFVDSDDYIIPNCLKELLLEIEEYDLDYIHFYNKTDRGGNISEKVTKSEYTPVSSGVDLFFSREVNWLEQITAWSKVYKRAFLEENNLYFAEDIMYEDNDYALRVVMHATSCRHIALSPYVYRANNDSITHVAFSNTHVCYWQKVWILILDLMPKLKSKDKRFVSMVQGYIKSDIVTIIRYISNNPVAKKDVKANLTAKEWYRVLSFLPLKESMKYFKTLFI